MEDKSSVSLSEILYGIQTVRTVEKDLIVTDSKKPKFPMHVKNKRKIKTRTEDELKLVNEKLQKLLSYNDTQNEAIAQRYAFGSKVGVMQKTNVNDQRTTLSDLFQKAKFSEEKINPKSNIRNQTEKRSVSSGKPTLKKKSTTTSIGTMDSASADEKLHKILRMLQRVYPEASVISQKSQNLWKYVTNSNLADEDIITLPCRAISEVSCPIYSGEDTNWRKECWIKSDAEYVILEL